MSTEPRSRVTEAVRRVTATPASGLFRFLNFERYTTGSYAIALPGAALFLGGLAYFAMEAADARAEEREQLGRQELARAQRDGG
jgi:hypothetical protein